AVICWIDFNNDGLPDLVAGNRLYRNIGSGQFVDITSESGLVIPDNSKGATVFDYDGDGLLDLYLLRQSSDTDRGDGAVPWVGDDSGGGENQLWRNMGAGRFRDVTSESGAGGGKRESFAAAAFFYDDDHFPDLYIANDFARNVLLQNRGDGTFKEITKESGTGDFATSMGVATGDIDNDGKAEIYVANMFSKMGRRIIDHLSEADYPPGIFEQIQGSCAGNRLYKGAGDGADREEISEQLGVNDVGWAYAPAMSDLNGDGWLDLYATTGFLSRDRRKPDG
ncbi:MAG: VCBS repeat-containing protein, partial [Verrucomicrobiota bacterium]